MYVNNYSQILFFSRVKLDIVENLYKIIQPKNDDDFKLLSWVVISSKWVIFLKLETFHTSRLLLKLNIKHWKICKNRKIKQRLPTFPHSVHQMISSSMSSTVVNERSTIPERLLGNEDKKYQNSQIATIVNCEQILFMRWHDDGKIISNSCILLRFRGHLVTLFKVL